MRTFDLSPFYRSTIGFDPLFEQRCRDPMEGGRRCALGHLLRDEHARAGKGNRRARSVQTVEDMPVEVRDILAVRE